MKKLFLLLVIISINFCSENIEKKPKEQYLTLISKNEPYRMSLVVIPLYDSDKKEEFIIEIYFFYSAIYIKKDYDKKYDDFTSFFIDVIYENIKLDKKIFEGFEDFLIDIKETKVYEDYNKYGLEYIIEKYLEATNQATKISPVYRNKINLSMEEKWDLARIFFYNSYVVNNSDVDGRFYFAIFPTKDE